MDLDSVHNFNYHNYMDLFLVVSYIRSCRQVGHDSMVGQGSSVGDKVSIKKSIIGQHCVIKDRVKITNSVVMDHVTIHEGYVAAQSINQSIHGLPCSTVCSRR